MNGQVYINASHLVCSYECSHFRWLVDKHTYDFLFLLSFLSRIQRADHSYEVEFEDRREDVLNDITDEEMECIKETFQQYDIDGDGGISKPEMMQLIRDRSTYRMEIITQKFDAFKASELEEMNQIKTEADAQLSRGLIKQQVIFELLELEHQCILMEVWR